MPLLSGRRYPYVKVYRPNGTPYAEGRGATPEFAVAAAMVAFGEEFGFGPLQFKTNIEIMGVTGQWVATVFEIMEG